MFPEFYEGSRQCTLLSRQRGRVVIMPVAHAATPAFFDRALRDLTALRGGAREAQPTEDAVRAAQRRFRVVVEGASDTTAERQMETDEMALIQRHVQAVEAVRRAGRGDEDIGGDAALVESASFVGRFQRRVEAGTLYSDAQLREIAVGMYQLPFPLPAGLVLQDAYMKPRLVMQHGDCIVNGDVVLGELRLPETDSAEALVADPVRFHALREASCVAKVAQLLDERDGDPDEERTVVVLWGHFHCPKILKMLSHNVNLFGEPAFSAETVSYGWTKELLREVYGLEF